jgi:hypothetical protein
MTDLAKVQAEFREERAGILEFDAGIPRNEAERQADTMSEEYRHQCEVRSVAAMYRDKGSEAVKEYLKDCAKHRGAVAVVRLRADALAEVARART